MRSGDRYVVLGLADVRSEWFRELARWSTSAVVPVEFLKAMSAEEVRAHLEIGRPLSALLVDDSVAGLDRDLVVQATDHGCAVITVTSGRSPQRWVDLGASATLPATFSPDQLAQVLASTAQRISDAGAALRSDGRRSGARGRRGHLVTVLGPGGTGASTVSMAIAQASAAPGSRDRGVCLADLALDAEQAMLHGAADVVPGLVELVDANRAGTPDVEAVRALTWSVPTRGYHLLLGLRRHRDWTALRPHAVDAAIDSLRRTFDVVIAEVDCDLEGEKQTGSTDVEDRNLLARRAVSGASVIVAVGTADMKGVHSLARVVRDVVDLAPHPRVVPVINRGPRNLPARAEISTAFATLVGAVPSVANPTFLRARRTLPGLIRDVAALPEAWFGPLGSSIHALLAAEVASGTEARSEPDLEPVPIAPGSLGSWTEQEEAG